MNDVISFCKTKDEWGGFSNMCAGFPLAVNGVKIRNSEALYQSCKFPHSPNVQKRIINERSPMDAKGHARENGLLVRGDWESVKVDVMYWCLQVKLCQNWDKFGGLLLDSGDSLIVEESRKDGFWGAKWNGSEYEGENVLGMLLTGLRDELRENPEHFYAIEPLDIPAFSLFGESIQPIDALI